MKEIHECPVCGKNAFPVIEPAVIYKPDPDTAIYFHVDCLDGIISEWMKEHGKWQGQTKLECGT